MDDLWGYIELMVVAEVEEFAPMLRQRLIGAFDEPLKAGAHSKSPRLVHAVRQSVLNLLAVALYQMFEQHWSDYLGRTEGQEALRANDGDQPGWEKIEELKLVANVSKHGDGRAERALRSKRPDMFKDPMHGGYGYLVGPQRVRAPLTGDGLYVAERDLAEYEQALLDFWRAVSAHHRAASP